MSSNKPPSAHHPRTALAHLSTRARRTVNPPLERGSTVLLDRVEDLYTQARSPYGRMGLAVQEELEAALCLNEGGVGAALTPNGLSACTLALLSCVSRGDHILVTDGAYGPTRKFCTTFLNRMGVDVTFFAPRTGSGIATLIRPETRAIFLESPSSLTMELHDLPAILSMTRPVGITAILDNTWSGGVYLKPFDFGIDLSVQALTKYPVGHADALGGAVIAGHEKALGAVLDTQKTLGISLGPDDAYLALRGMRTLHARLRAHETAAKEIARHLELHPSVTSVLHPALIQHPDHAIWGRDFSGSSGLFSFTVKASSEQQLNSALNSCKLFRFGFSWGGFESLIIPCGPQLLRSEERLHQPSSAYLLRVHIGLEDVDDLWSELDSALSLLKT